MILAFIDLQVTQMLPYQASSQMGLSVQEKTFKIDFPDSSCGWNHL